MSVDGPTASRPLQIPLAPLTLPSAGQALVPAEAAPSPAVQAVPTTRDVIIARGTDTLTKAAFSLSSLSALGAFAFEVTGYGAGPAGALAAAAVTLLGGGWLSSMLAGRNAMNERRVIQNLSDELAGTRSDRQQLQIERQQLHAERAQFTAERNGFEFIVQQKAEALVGTQLADIGAQREQLTQDRERLEREFAKPQAHKLGSAEQIQSVIRENEQLSREQRDALVSGLTELESRGLRFVVKFPSGNSWVPVASTVPAASALGTLVNQGFVYIGPVQQEGSTRYISNKTTVLISSIAGLASYAQASTGNVEQER